MRFTHLHVHSHYSLLDGLAKIDELLDKAKSLEMDSLALTDHGVMYGAVEFFQKAKKKGIKPIIGMEAYLAVGRMTDRRPKIDEKRYHLVLLAKNKEGYENLMQLATKANLEGFYYKPRFDKELLKKHSRGLIGLSACLNGEIPQAIISNRQNLAEKLALEYQEIFGKGNFYLELEHHPNLKNQELVNQKLIEISRKYNIPLVATNDVHYLNPEDAEAQDILLCIQMNKKVDDKKRLSMLSDDYSLRSQKEMMEAFQDIPEAISNTQKIAHDCNLEIELGKTLLPHFEVPDGETADEYLRKLAYRGLEKQYGAGTKDKNILDRLEYELSVIKKTGFAPCFLITQDFVNWAKTQGIVVGPGRGSGAASLVSYLLNITSVDPLKYGLLFERFLNPERIEMPDFDIDFADDRRDEVINYVINKYGSNHVSQIITFGTMAARGAVRDAGRALGFPYNFCDEIAKMIPFSSSLKKALEQSNELKTLYENDPSAKKLLDTAQKLEGVARHASTHACGVVISKESLEHYTPRQRPSQNDQTIVTQYEMHSIADLGLLKLDFLGLKNLTIIQNAIRIIAKTKNIKINIDEIPLDDKKTFDIFRKAQTTGVFQLESAGMKRYLKQLKPSRLEDIIAMISLYRPGPIELIPDFIARKYKQKKISYLHPKLEPILKETYGIAVYQEQVLRIVRDLAGFTLGEADVLRKAVGKKIPELLKEQKTKFIQGCLKNNISQETAEKIFAFIEPFAGYGFNKAHATSYAMIGYQTAYLKAHFPAEFMAALLTSDQNDTDRVAIEIDEARSMGIPVLPPDINESFADFTVVQEKNQKESIRFGLAAIKNVGKNVVETIIRERKRGGKFKGLDDFIERVQSKDLNKKSLESLIKCGALDKLGRRGILLKNIETILTHAKEIQKAKANGQASLFASDKIDIAPIQLKPADDIPKSQKLSWEKELLGLYVSESPLENFRDFLENHTTTLKNISDKIQNSQIKVGGIINKIKKIITKGGKPMLFAELQLIDGKIEVLVWPRVLEKNPDIWQEDKIVIVSGKLNDKNGAPKILSDSASELNEKILQNQNQNGKNYKKESLRSLYLTISEENNLLLLKRIKDIITTSEKGASPVYLSIPNGNPEPDKIETPYRIKLNDGLIKVFEGLVGKNNVKIKP